MDEMSFGAVAEAAMRETNSRSDQIERRKRFRIIESTQGALDAKAKSTGTQQLGLTYVAHAGR